MVPLAGAERVGKPFQRVGIDFVKLPMTHQGNDHIVVVIDHASKWVEAQACKGETAEAAAKILFEEIVCRHGCPQEVWSDRGKAFMSEAVRKVSEECGFKQCLTSGYHPETNGLTERMNKTLMDILAKIAKDQNRWDEHLKAAVWAYNSSKHSSTGYSPYEMLHGVQAPMIGEHVWMDNEAKTANEIVDERRSRTSSIQTQALENQRVAANQQKKQHDKRARDSIYKPGDIVRWYRPRVKLGESSKLSSPWTGPWKVLERVGEVNYKLQNEKGEVTTTPAHAQDLKPTQEHFEGEDM